MIAFTGAFAALVCTALVWAQQTPLNLLRGGGPEPGSAPQDTKRIFTPELTAFIQDVVEQNKIPGLSLGVVHGADHTSEFATWGRRDEDGTKVTQDTLFYLASCSKAFLSSSVGILMDDFAHGRNKTPLPPGLTQFNWYTKVKDILPDDWKLMDDWATEKATIRDVLSHQSGLPRHDFSYTPNDTSLSVIHKMRYLRPAFELRERYHYNNLMFMLGSYIVGKYAGMTYPEFVKARIWDPLNMSDTTFYQSEASRHGKLTQTWASNGRRIPIWWNDGQVPMNAGPGGILSSAEDMTKWLRTLLNAGVDPVTNVTIIPQFVFDTVTGAQMRINSRGPWPEFSFSAYGMGWRRESYQGHELVYHGGGIPGFSIETYFLPSDNIGIIALSNGDAVHMLEEAIIYRIVEDYLGLKRIHSSRLLSKAEAKYSAASHPQSKSDVFQDIRPKDSQSLPPLDLEAYAGTYFNAGYPNVTLCAPTSSSAECATILDQFALFEDVHHSRTIYMGIDSVWISHGRLHHLEDNKFRLSGSYLFPQGYGKDGSPFEVNEAENPGLTVEFVLNDAVHEDPKVIGVGLYGLVGEITMQQREGGTVEETAEVYFVKVR